MICNKIIHEIFDWNESEWSRIFGMMGKVSLVTFDGCFKFLIQIIMIVYAFLLINLVGSLFLGKRINVVVG